MELGSCTLYEVLTQTIQFSHLLVFWPHCEITKVLLGIFVWSSTRWKDL